MGAKIPQQSSPSFGCSCGYTPYYTCAVWGGYDDNKSVDDTQYRFRIWRSIMDRIHDDLEPKKFEMTSSIVKKTVCKETGLLPYKGDDIDKYECPDKTFYLIEVKKAGQRDRKLFYSQDGLLLKDVEDKENDDVLPTISF